MKLMLKNTTGESVTLIIRPDDTFIDLRERVEEELGLCLDLNDIVKGQTYLESQKVLDFFSEIPYVEENSLLSGYVPDVECVVPGCYNKKSTNPDKTFFEFPLEEIRNHQWALYCHRLLSGAGKRRLNITSASRICSDHFRPEQFVKNTTTILKRTAVPCINPEIGTVKDIAINKSVTHHDAYNTALNNTSKPQALNTSKTGDSVICRLCAQTCTDYVFIFDERGKRLGIEKKINACLPMTIKITDPFPKQVCCNCCEELEKAYRFSQSSVDAQNRLIAEKKTSLSRSVIIVDHKGSGEDPNISIICNGKESFYRSICPCCTEGKMVNNISTNQLCHETFSTQKLLHNEIFYEKELSTIKDTYNGVNKNSWEAADNAFEYSCQLCSADFRLSSDLLPHSLMHSQDGTFFCCLCKNIYESKSELESHFAEHNVMTVKHNLVHDGKFSHKCETCGMGFKTFPIFANHNCTTVNWASNRCNICHKMFRSEGRLEFHKKFHEKGSKPGYCELCSKTFSDELKLYKHVTYLHGEGKVHYCEKCSKVFRSVSSLKYHQRSHQGDSVMKPYSCDVCGKCFIRRSMLRNHVAAAHKTLICQTSCFSCNFCKESFPSTYTVISHLERVHPDNNTKTAFDMFSVNKVYTCEYCKRCFTNILHLNIHRSKHRNDMPYECKYCDFVFSSYNELNKHQTNHKSDKIFKEYSFEFAIHVTFLCEFCDRSFMSYIKYTEHLTVHYGSHPYVCRFCGEKFSTIEESCSHRTTHVDNETNASETNFYRPYECHFCNKSFAIEDALIKHIRMHTGEKPFICDQCGKGFSQSSGLYTHQKVHSSERPYTCPLCPRKFKIKGDRDVHVRKHSGERPYKCEFCGKAFMTQHVYSQHRKIHTGERPYKCDVCGISFRRSHVLTVHKRIHTGEKPNACDICGKRYRQKGDMLKHRRIQHTIKTEAADS